MLVESFKTVQQDTIDVFKFVSEKKWKSNLQEQNMKVAFAALRIIAAVGLAISAGVAVSLTFALPVTPILALIKLGVTVLVGSICYDAFIIANNGTAQMDKLKGSWVKAMSLASDILDLCAGKKQITSAPRQPLTNGTIWQKYWDISFSYIK